jgi:sugar lactone lactonase YvrE
MTLATGPVALAATNFPDVISLPNGFRPEGVAIKGTTLYTGSLGGQGIWRANIRTGEGASLRATGGPFTGMKVDDFGRLWVSGAGTGRAFVFDANTGAELASFTFASAPTFINDVVVTDDAAYFTDSQRAQLYRVAIGDDGAIGAVTTIDLTGEIQMVPGFNLNGIDATEDGRTLIVVNSTTGKLYTIDTTTFDANEIDLGGATVTQGDGILLQGRTLYVVRNQSNQIAVVRLSGDLSSGSITRVITSPNFSVPTTIARHGNSLYAVNARFGVPSPGTATYTAVRVDR